MRYSQPTDSWLAKLSDGVFAAAWAAADLPFPAPDISSAANRKLALLAIKRLPAEAFTRLNRIFAEAARLGDERGVNALKLAAKHRRAELEAELADLKTAVDRALWAALQWPEIFDHAIDVAAGEAVVASGPDYNNRFQARARPDFVASNADSKAFETAVRAALERCRQPTDRVKIEQFVLPHADLEDESVVQLTIRLGEPAETKPDFSGDEIGEVRYRPVRDLFLYFAPATGRLDIATRHGGERLRKLLADAFCETVLDQRPPDEVEAIEVDMVSLLGSREFPTDAADGIESVTLVQLSMSSDRIGSVKIDAKPGLSVWSFESSLIAANDEFLTPSHAVLEFAFLSAGATRRRRVLRAKLSTPNGVAFPRASAAQRAMMERYLHQWGLIREPNPATLRAA